MTARLIKFMGSHPELTTGHMYSAREYARVANIKPNAMSTRLHRVLEVHDSHLRPMYQNYDYEGKAINRSADRPLKSSFETHAEKLSGKWLNRRLI